MTVTFLEKHVVSIASGSVSTPSYDTLAVPFSAGARMVMQQIGGNSTRIYKFGPSGVTITVDPVSGAHDGFAITSDPVGVPHGASHVVFLNVDGSAVNFEIGFGAEH